MVRVGVVCVPLWEGQQSVAGQGWVVLMHVLHGFDGGVTLVSDLVVVSHLSDFMMVSHLCQTLLKL